MGTRSGRRSKLVAMLRLDHLVAGLAMLVLLAGLGRIAASVDPGAQVDPRDAGQMARSLMAP
jgi:hypothetical protein